MEDVMLKYYMANADKAGVGLECLPGVKQLLQELKVCSFCNILIIFILFHPFSAFFILFRRKRMKKDETG